MQKRAGFFSAGDLILYGKYKNKRGVIKRLFVDEKGHPAVEIEPIPKGRKQNKIMGLFKFWHAPAPVEEKTAMVTAALRIAARFQDEQEMPVRIASKWTRASFNEHYARLLIAMSWGEAKETLGFPSNHNPTPEEVKDAWKTLAFKHHPDRGGDPTKMRDVNVAKDVLLGNNRQNWRPEPAPARPERKPQPKWQDDPEVVIRKGQSFAAAMADSGAPSGVEWKFVSIPEWYWETTSHPGHRVWVLYGQTEQKHVFMALKELGESAGIVWETDPKTGERKKVHIEQDWQSSMMDAPISQNIAKIAPKMLKMTATAWTDAKMPPPKKYVAWSGDKPTEQALQKVPRGGGAALKDILVGVGLLNDEDPTVIGRKSIVEIYFKMSKEREEKLKKIRAEKKPVYNHQHYDFIVRVNGKECVLEDETIVKMEKRFLPYVLKWEVTEGRAKNLTRMRGGVLKFDASVAIEELVNCLTGEPSWLHIALEKAAEEWQTPKTAFVRQAGAMSLFEAADILGESPYDTYQAIVASFAPESTSVVLKTAASLAVGKWYVQKTSASTMYFHAEDEQKNGGWSGTLVTLDDKPKPKVKKYSVPKMGAGLWKATSDVPEEVTEAVR